MIRHLRLTSILSAILFAAIAMPVVGQEAPPPPPRPEGEPGVERQRPPRGDGEFRGQRDGSRRGQGRRGQELAMLKQRLSLSDEQAKQIGKILEDGRKAMQKKRTEFQNNPPEDRSAAREQMMALRKGADDKIKAVLNEEQAAAFAKLQKKRQERIRQQRGNRRSQGPPPEGEGRRGRRGPQTEAPPE